VAMDSKAIPAVAGEMSLGSSAMAAMVLFADGH